MKRLLVTLCIIALSFNLSGCIFFGVRLPFDNTEPENHFKDEVIIQETTTEEETTTEQESTTIEEITTTAPLKTYSTVEEYYTSPLISKQIEAKEKYLLNLYKTVYSDIQFIFHGNTVTYVYTYLMEVDVESTNEELGKHFKNIDLSNDFKIIEEETGISDITLEFVYQNRNGTKVFSKAFTR